MLPRSSAFLAFLVGWGGGRPPLLPRRVACKRAAGNAVLTAGGRGKTRLMPRVSVVAVVSGEFPVNFVVRARRCRYPVRQMRFAAATAQPGTRCLWQLLPGTAWIGAHKPR